MPTQTNEIRGTVHSEIFTFGARDFALLTIDYPPINAGSQPMRQALLSAINGLDLTKISGVILRGAGGNFVGGADIREFDAVAREPHLPEIIAALEDLPVPVVAAIDGVALGGGYELALGCDARVGSENALVGLPEVTLGLIPGAGGTYRLPRIIGVPAAIELITSGRRVRAPEALQLGMIDKIVTDGLEAGAAAYLAGMKGKRRLRELPICEPDAAELASARSKALAAAGASNAVPAAIKAVELWALQPAGKGLAAAREIALRLRGQPQSQALRHLFFAERRAGRIEGDPSTRPIHSAGVVGAGRMGRGIAVALARSGLTVKLVDSDDRQLTDAFADIRRLAEREALRGDEGARQVPGRIEAATLDELTDRDIVFEAVVEDMAVKRGLLGELEPIVRADTILATNTSYLDIDAMGADLGDPSRLAGFHFFNPAHVMRLVEVVRTDTSSPEVLASLVALAKRMRKLPIIAGVDNGFVANQMYAAYRQQAEFLLQEGAMPWEIDQAMRDFGMAMGPFKVFDLAGLDIAWARRKWQASSRDPEARYVEIPDRLCELGRFGRKTGRGWYDYRGDSRGIADSETEALVIASSHAAGIERRTFTPDEIVRRLLAAVVNTAADILDRGIARQAGDIDLAWVYGFGFPKLKGGPLHWASRQDRARVFSDVESMVSASGKGHRMAPGLQALLAMLYGVAVG